MRFVEAKAAEALAPFVWHDGHFGFNFGDVISVDDDRRQVGIGHVAVVVGVFFAALAESLLLGVVPAAGFLDDSFALFEQFDLAVDFVITAFSTTRKLLRFLVSERVPSSSVLLTLTLTSKRMLP